MKCIIKEKAGRYENTETGEEYLWLAGSLVWPGKKPGYAIIVAVKQEKGQDPVLMALEEVEDMDVPRLIKGAFALYEQYGANCQEIRWTWYGDAESELNASFLYAFNEMLRRQDKKQAFALVGYPEWKQQGFFEAFCHLIRAKAQNGSLDVHLCEIVRNDLRSLQTPATEDPANHPPTVALGYVVKGLEYRPWMFAPGKRLKSPSELRIDLLEQGGALLQQAREELYLAREMSREGAAWGSSLFDEQDDWDEDIYVRRARNTGAQGDIVPGSGVE